MLNYFSINGIKTKIIQTHKGCSHSYSLMIDDPEQAKFLVNEWIKENKVSYPVDDYTKIALAMIERPEADPTWEICDWRLARKSQPLSFYLCRSWLEEALISREIFYDPKKQKNIKLIRNLSVTTQKNGDNLILHWPSFNGRVMDEIRYQANPTHQMAYQWSKTEAIDYLKKVQDYWNDFQGDSMKEAKLKNPFQQISAMELTFP